MNFKFFYNTNKKYVVDSSPYLISMILFFNAMLNLIQKNKNYFNSSYLTEYVNAETILITPLVFLFLYFNGQVLKTIFKLKIISLGIVIFITSFFVIDLFFMAIGQFFQFKFSVLFTFFIYILIYILNRKISQSLLIISLLILINILFDTYFSEAIINNPNFLDDEKYFWYPSTKNIYENNLLYAYKNNLVSGYGLLIPHIYSTFSYLFTFNNVFAFSSSFSLSCVLLVLFFITELKVIELSVKINFIFYFILFITTSHWFLYLYFVQIGGEPFSAYLFGVLFYLLYKGDNLKIVIFLTGLLYFTKYLISIYAFLPLLIMYKGKLRESILCITPFVVYLINHFLFFKSQVLDTYIVCILKKLFQNITCVVENNSLPLRVELRLSNSIELTNIEQLNRIYKNLILDKPLVLIFIFFLFLIIFNLEKVKNNYFLKFSIIITILNTAIVLIVYMYIDPSNTNGSEYRYLTNIYLIWFLAIIELSNNRFKFKDIKFFKKSKF